MKRALGFGIIDKINFLIVPSIPLISSFNIIKSNLIPMQLPFPLDKI